MLASRKIIAALLAVLLALAALAGCSKDAGGRVTDVASAAQTVRINGVIADTVEAQSGAFEGKQGDTIEFEFAEPETFNTVFIIEKTTTVRQFNIYAKVDGLDKLVYTGKRIVAENCEFETVEATALKIEILNTEIGDDHFIIQGISCYCLGEETT